MWKIKNSAIFGCKKHCIQNWREHSHKNHWMRSIWRKNHLMIWKKSQNETIYQDCLWGWNSLCGIRKLGKRKDHRPSFDKVIFINNSLVVVFDKVIFNKNVFVLVFYKHKWKMLKLKDFGRYLICFVCLFVKVVIFLWLLQPYSYNEMKKPFQQKLYLRMMIF